jgi:hypothetical protein
MGRLPDQWAGRKITMRVPYVMPGEINLTSGQPGVQFPDATFTHNVDKPFEVHRLKPWAVALDVNGDVIFPQPPQEALQSLIRVRISDLGKNELMTKSPQLLALLPKGSAEATWEWAEPYTIVRSESFQVVADAIAFTNFVGMQTIRLAWKYEGFLLVIAPPSESR